MRPAWSPSSKVLRAEPCSSAPWIWRLFLCAPIQQQEATGVSCPLQPPMAPWHHSPAGWLRKPSGLPHREALFPHPASSGAVPLARTQHPASARVGPGRAHGPTASPTLLGTGRHRQPHVAAGEVAGAGCPQFSHLPLPSLSSGFNNHLLAQYGKQLQHPQPHCLARTFYNLRRAQARGEGRCCLSHGTSGRGGGGSTQHPGLLVGSEGRNGAEAVQMLELELELASRCTDIAPPWPGRWKGKHQRGGSGTVLPGHCWHPRCVTQTGGGTGGKPEKLKDLFWPGKPCL